MCVVFRMDLAAKFLWFLMLFSTNISELSLFCALLLKDRGTSITGVWWLYGKLYYRRWLCPVVTPDQHSYKGTLWCCPVGQWDRTFWFLRDVRLIFSAISSINAVNGNSYDPSSSFKQGFPQLHQERKLMTFVFRLNNLLIYWIKDFPIRGKRLI